MLSLFTTFSNLRKRKAELFCQVAKDHGENYAPGQPGREISNPNGPISLLRVSCRGGLEEVLGFKSLCLVVTTRIPRHFNGAVRSLRL